MSRRIIPPADDPDLMEKVFRYVNACDRRNWRPVFTREQFRAIYQAVMRDTISRMEKQYARPPMPEEMLDRHSNLELAEIAWRFPAEDLTDPAVQAKRMYPGSYEAHDLPPRSM